MTLDEIADEMRRCSVDGCDNAVRCRGWCIKHYKRMTTHGTLDDPRPSSIERWATKVDIFDGQGCWFWTGSTSGGYGLFWSDGRKVKAHRFAYETAVGPIPPGLDLDHLCRQRDCVNPRHLQPVTRGENTRRGMAPAAVVNRRKVCSNGHALTPDNLYHFATGKKRCRICVLAEGAASRARRRQRRAVS